MENIPVLFFGSIHTGGNYSWGAKNVTWRVGLCVKLTYVWKDIKYIVINAHHIAHILSTEYTYSLPLLHFFPRSLLYVQIALSINGNLLILWRLCETEFSNTF